MENLLQEKDLELVVSEETLGRLTTNAQQIKTIVENAISNYSIENYDSSNIEKAKKDKAALNKAAKALNSKRIEIEKEFVKPFAEFKGIISDTVKLIGECSSKIDVLVKEDERKYKEEKRAKLVAYYFSINKNSIPFEKIEESRWLNKTVKESEAIEDINEIVDLIDKNLKAISKWANADALTVYYKNCLNLNQTIQYQTQLEEQKKKAEQNKVETPKEDAKPQDTKPQETEQKVQSGLYVRTFKVECTRDLLIELGNFMNANGIKFEKV